MNEEGKVTGEEIEERGKGERVKSRLEGWYREER